MLSLNRVRRFFHIAVGLMVLVLLLGPLDCFAAGAPLSRVADCCLKGRCVPTANSDTCCKNTVPDRDQFVPSKAAEHSSPLVAMIALPIPALDCSSTFLAFDDTARHPPPRIELSVPSLPLLV
jgi:hypothetical protein